jgi:HK97 family phage portal protein
MAGPIPAAARPGPLARIGQAISLAWRSVVGGTRTGGPVGPVNWTSKGGIPTGWNWNWWQQGFNHLQGGESATVNACVNAYAQTLAQLPGGHYRKLDGGGAELVTTSALARVLRNPNGYQTRSDFLLNLVTELLFHGNAYAWAERNDRFEVTALHLMPARACEPLIDPESRTVFYALAENPLAGTADYAVPARDVLHLRVRTMPGRPLHGVSPITWAAMARDANVAIAATQAAFFANASQPSGFLSTKERVSKEQMDGLREAWENRSTGVAMGSVPILGGGLEFQAMGISSQDSQLVEAFGMTVADIARAFAVPLPIIGDLSNATFNNVENLIGLWLSQGLGFYLEHIEIAFDKFFGLPAGEYVEFDSDSLMRTAFRDRIEGLARAVSGGIYAPDEARAREGLPPAEGGFGKEPRLQAQVVPLSAAGSAPAAPSAPAAGDPPAEPSAPDPANDNPAPEEIARAIRAVTDRAMDKGSIHGA